MRGPNDEQKLAIETTSGAILKAGAGSGKTFVIVEHLIYLVALKEQEWKHKSFEEQEKEVSRFLQNLVVMTFTRYAANELKVRVFKRFNQECDKGKFWELVYGKLSFLNIQTIDSFSLKLCRLGLIPSVPSSVEVTQPTEYEQKVRELVYQWINKSSVVGEFEKSLIQNPKSVISSLNSILADPSLRKEWKKIPSQDGSLECYLNEILNFYGVNDFIAQQFFYESTKASVWLEIIKNFESKKKKVQTWDDLVNLCRLFARDQRFSPRGKDLTLEDQQYLEKFKELRKKLPLLVESYQAWQESFACALSPWFKGFYQLMNDVETSLKHEAIYSYSDITFFVEQDLEKSEVRDEIHQLFSYFIVDEFQDTSFHQYNILLNLAGNDLKKIFAVGDPKQAIYGFRGGELSVFRDLESKTNNLSMVSNYRSSSAIVNFNNCFFDWLFHHEDKSQFQVKLEHQVPQKEGHYPLVQVKRLSVSPEDNIDEKESDYLCDYYKDNPPLDSAILYKRLKPSLLLIKKFIKEGISFNAQIKFPLMDNPLIGVVKVLLENILKGGEELDDFDYFLITQYFNVLGPGESISRSTLNYFFRDFKIFDLAQSFRKLVYSSGLQVQAFQPIMGEVLRLLEECQGSPEKALISLNMSKSERSQLSFYHGKNSHSLTIMTAHGSKGLEYSEVILAGMSNNSRFRPSDSFIGKMPASLRWSSFQGGKKSYHSPMWVYENDLNKLKEASESRRLFYVAATRACEKLVLLTSSGKIGKNSWEEDLQGFLQENDEHASLIEVENVPLKEQVNVKPNSSLFMDAYLGTTRGKEELWGVTSELSVTRMLDLFACPRKFYLSNIIKLGPEFILSDEEKEFFSSKERGTQVHYEISQLVRYQKMGKMLESFPWLLSQLNEAQRSGSLISEKSIKFDLFGFTVNGIIDLFIQDKEGKVLEVWDFKTGELTSEQEENYFSQLKIYAYALYSKELIPKEKSVKLKVCSIDEERFYEKETNLLDLTNTLFSEWSKLANLDSINQSHCSKCSYQKICDKGNSTSCTE